jgi:hypothetical protein
MTNTNLSSGNNCDYQFFLNQYCSKMSKNGMDDLYCEYGSDIMFARFDVDDTGKNRQLGCYGEFDRLG